MGKLRGIDYGTGKYPNNVCNYLLNQDVMWRTYIPAEDNDKLNDEWAKIESQLSEDARTIIRYMFVDGLTFDQIGRLMLSTGVTVRNKLFDIFHIVNEDGYILQPLLSWSIERGYTKKITKEALLRAWQESKGLSLTKADVEQFYEMLRSGMSVTNCAGILRRSTDATLQILYAKCEMWLVGKSTNSAVNRGAK